MNIIHQFKKKRIKGTGDKNFRIITSNSIGGYYLMPGASKSRYDGLFFFINGKMTKICEPFSINGDTVTNKFFQVEIEKKGARQIYFMPDACNALVIERSITDEIAIELDIKRSYDNSESGRSYKLEMLGNTVLISFEKTGDTNDEKEKYKVFVAIHCEAPPRLVQSWVKKDYGFDVIRNSPPFERYIYSAIATKSKKMVIAASAYRENALLVSENAYNNSDNLLKKKQKRVEAMLETSAKNVHINKKDAEMAYFCAVNSLDMLSMKNGIMAGLPWFFQDWVRDEMVSIEAMRLIGRDKFSKQIILSRMHSIRHAKMPSYEGADAYSADAPLWLFFRAFRMFHNLNADANVTNKEEHNLSNALCHFIDAVEASSVREGLISNNAGETWMDSLLREGRNIEMQALMLALYDEAHKMTGNPIYQKKLEQMKKKVIDYFYIGNSIIDSPENPVIAPNVFIAAYAFKRLLSNAEWTSCFQEMLPHLWLDWGGLSTIDKMDFRYHSRHTGEKNDSYHQGDSWYYLNNLAAIALLEMNKKRFSEYILKILNASTREILYSGIIGSHAELSSSEMQSSEGCLMQAWSSAMYIELIHRLYGNND